MKRSLNRIRALGIVVLAWAIMPSSFAAPLNLTPTWPDVNLAFGSITYVATCVNGNGASGVCGQVASSGGGSPATRTYSTMTSGLLTITGSAMTLNITGSGAIQVTNGSQGLSYALNANFDANGNFVSGGSLVIKGTTTNSSFQSGLLLSASLTNFGYAGGTTNDSAGTFEFKFGGTVTGDMAPYWLASTNGVIATTTSMATGSSYNPQWTTGTWDATPTDGIGQFFLRRSFTTTSSSNTVNTFVPVPAAVWLFGSGLLGLVGIARRKALRVSV